MIDIFEKTLGVLPLPDEFEATLLRVREEYNKQGVFFLEDAYLARMEQKCDPFPQAREEILQAAKALRADADAALYALFVCRAMEDRTLFMQRLKCIEFPKNAHPLLAFLTFLPAIEELFDFLVQRKLPADVIAATVGQFEACLYVFKERFDHLGMNKRYFDHMQGYVDHKFLNVGRLRYEISTLSHLFVLERIEDGKRVLCLKDAEMNAAGLYRGTPPETTEAGFHAFFREEADAFVGTPVSEQGRCQKESVRFPKAEYRLLLQPGDTVLDVHIPAPGPLTEALCAESYARARALFAAHYPEISPKSFHCHSWMMAPELAEVLKPTSNLLAFQRPFLRYPAHTKGEDVLNFVFKWRFTSYADLPEQTSLQRALKARYLAGEYLYEYCGVIPFEEETK